MPAIKFSKVWKKNLQDLDEVKKVYAHAQVRGEVSEYHLSQDVSWGSTLTSEDIVTVLLAFGERVSRHLASGDTVDLDELGKFYVTLNSKGAFSLEEFSHDCIKKVNVRFKPGRVMLENMKGANFEHVIKVESRKEALKNEISSSSNG